MITTRSVAAIAKRLMTHPTAPYFEHAVRSEVEYFCLGNRLPFKRDAFGNILVRLQAGPAPVRPLVLAAHMDHPGFEAVAGPKKGRWNLRFNGGVPDPFFRAGLKVRLFPGGAAAKLASRVGRKKVFRFKVRRPLEIKPEFAVWDLQEFALRNGRIHGRACDDLIGVATILAVMAELKQSRAKANVLGLISRAEEIGFRGALAATAANALPAQSLVISLETSREMPGVKMGEGVILRVGDKTSIFDTKAMRFLGELCAELRKRDPRFHFQRALMSGGTCEATAFQEYGYQTGAVCVALGNYHNCAPKNRIEAEYIDVADAVTMAQLLANAAKNMPRFDALVGKLPKRLERLRKEGVKRLRRTA
jgi:putative aminopeptidase FrvX